MKRLSSAERNPAAGQAASLRIAFASFSSLLSAFLFSAFAGIILAATSPAAWASETVESRETAEVESRAKHSAQEKSLSLKANLKQTNKKLKRNRKNMVYLPGAEFLMGANIDDFEDCKPVHRVKLGSFWIDKTEVTNREFARFVSATGYKTSAERKPESKDLPGIPEDKLVPGALVFIPPDGPVSKASHYRWWHYQAGACWRHPEGPESSIEKRMDHPVVHVSYEDALAYAKWAGKRLPSEAEFEYAARGGLEQARYSWGNELKPKGNWQCNIWQGVFPYKNTKEDGYVGTSPVSSFAANGFGLFDMTGNVWEWCSDWYHPDYYKSLPQDRAVENPAGSPSSLDPLEPGIAKRVQSGGSFLCTDQYCLRYLVGARGKGEPGSPCSNVGFRCVSDGD